MIWDMGRLIAQTAGKYASLPAIINTERGRELSYAQMNRISDQACHVLSGHFGLAPGERYATLLNNDNMALFHPWMFKSTATAVWLDSRESDAELIHQMDLAQPRVIFMEADFVARLWEPLAQRGMKVVAMDPPKQAGVEHFWDLVAQAGDRPFLAGMDAEDPAGHTAVLRFTGGTTGKPKCAAYSLMNLYGMGLNPVHYMEVVPFDRPRFMPTSPINHAASGSVMVPVHVKGGCVVTINKSEVVNMGRVIAEKGVNLIYTVPTVLYRMLDENLPASHDLSSLKTIRYGAASMSPAKLAALLEQFGPIFVQGYGATEAWPSCTILPRSEHGLATPEQVARLASVGRPAPAVEVLIVGEDGKELPPGRDGEIWVRGINTIRGYFNDPEQTRDNFTPDGFWRSGDVGRRDEEGFVYLVDRKKDMVVSGGYNVYATEVENCLNAHPAVEVSAVVGVPDEVWGEAVWAAVVLRAGASATPAELIEHCKNNLARYKAPKQVRILPQLPLTTVGKVLRRKVRDQLLEG